jgi:hypothetical protein
MAEPSLAQRMDIRFKLSFALRAVVLLIVVLVFTSEFVRLFTYTTSAMHTGLQQQAPPLLPQATDFAVFYTAGRLVREGKIAHLYDPDTIAPEILRTQGYRNPERAVKDNSNEPFLRYYNPPIWAIATAPLTQLDLYQAYRLMAVLNLLFLGGICLLCAKILEWRPVLVGVFLLGVFAYDPTHANIQGGQVGIFIALSSGLGFYFVKRSRQRLASLAMTPAIVKPQFLAFNWLAIVRKDKKAALWLAGFAALALLPFLLIGPGGVRDYIDIIRVRADLDTNEAAFARIVLSWVGFYFTLTGGPINPVLLAGLDVITLALFLWIVREGDLSLLPIAGATVSLLVVPHSHHQDWFLLVPGAAFLLGRQTRPVFGVVSAALLLAIFIGVNTWDHAARAAAGGGHGVFVSVIAGFALLVWLAALPLLERWQESRASASRRETSAGVQGLRSQRPQAARDGG